MIRGLRTRLGDRHRGQRGGINEDVLYYAVHAFAHVHTFAHFHRFGSIDTFQFTFLLKKKTIDKVTIIDKES